MTHPGAEEYKAYYKTDREPSQKELYWFFGREQEVYRFQKKQYEDSRRAPYEMIACVIVLYFVHAIILNLFGVDILQYIGAAIEAILNWNESVKVSIYNWLF